MLELEATDINTMSGNTNELKLSGTRLDRSSVSVDDGAGGRVTMAIGDSVTVIRSRFSGERVPVKVEALGSTSGSLLRIRVSRETP